MSTKPQVPLWDGLFSYEGTIVGLEKTLDGGISPVVWRRDTGWQPSSLPALKFVFFPSPTPAELKAEGVPPDSWFVAGRLGTRSRSPATAFDESLAQLSGEELRKAWIRGQLLAALSLGQIERAALLMLTRRFTNSPVTSMIR